MLTAHLQVVAEFRVEANERRLQANLRWVRVGSALKRSKAPSREPSRVPMPQTCAVLIETGLRYTVTPPCGGVMRWDGKLSVVTCCYAKRCDARTFHVEELHFKRYTMWREPDK